METVNLKKFILLTIFLIFLIILCSIDTAESYRNNKSNNVDPNIENDPIPSRNTANNTGRKEGELRKNGI